MISGVYLFKNLVNGKCYAGQAADLKQRRRDHLWSLRHNKHANKALQSDFNLLGESSFEFIIMFECTDERDKLEQNLIAIFDLMNPLYGYNLDMGGGKGRKLTKAHKEKLSKAKQGVYIGEKHPNFGKKFSEEWKKNISEGHLKVRHKKSKLSVENVKEIKKLLRDTDLTHKQIATLFNVGPTTIGNINVGKKWKDIQI